LTIQKHTKGTFFRVVDTKYYFVITKTKLEKSVNGTVSYHNFKPATQEVKKLAIVSPF